MQPVRQLDTEINRFGRLLHQEHSHHAHTRLCDLEVSLRVRREDLRKKKKSIERTIRTGIRGERDKKRPCEYVQ